MDGKKGSRKKQLFPFRYFSTSQTRQKVWFRILLYIRSIVYILFFFKLNAINFSIQAPYQNTCNAEMKYCHSTFKPLLCLFIYTCTLPFGNTLFSQTCSQGLSGTYKIGASGTFTSITAAFNQLQQKGVSGPVILELNNDYNSSNEVFPLTLHFINCTDSVNTITIRPAAGAGTVTINGNDPSALIDLNDAKFITIDGRTGDGDTTIRLTINNSNTNAGAAIRFINDASYNKLQYLNIRGASTSILSGVVFFSTSDSSAGNRYNRIDNCRVYNSDTYPANLVYSNGTISKMNSGNVINSCELFNFFSYKGTSQAVYISDGSEKFTITNNSIFQTVTHSYLLQSAGANIYGVQVMSWLGGGYTISGNYIGGTAAHAGGTKWQATGEIAFRGICIGNKNGKQNASIVSNNTITNIEFQLTTDGGQRMIALGDDTDQYPTFNGTCTGNNIGSMDGSTVISMLFDNSTSFEGIFAHASAPDDSLIIAGNRLGALRGIPSNSSLSTLFTFYGVHIMYTQRGNKVRIFGNEIGSSKDSLSIFNGTDGTSYGVLVDVTGDNTHTYYTAVENNVVSHIICAPVSPAVASLYGILVNNSEYGTITVNGNTVASCSINASSNFQSTQLIGISVSTAGSGFSDVDISRNKVFGLINAAPQVTGVSFSSSQNALNDKINITGNLIDGLEGGSNIDAPAQVDALYIRHWSRKALIANNMIRLGLDLRGNSIPLSALYTGIDDYGGNNLIMHNSILIAGTANASGILDLSSNYNRAVPGDTIVLENNIFENLRNTPARPNQQPPAQKCITTLGFSSMLHDYNIYYTKGDYTRISPDAATLADYKSLTGQESHSLAVDPLFKAPFASTGILDLHLDTLSAANSAGNKQFTTTYDFDGDNRLLYTPVDIGADAFNYKWVDTTNSGPADTTVIVVDTTILPGTFYSVYPVPFTGSVTIRISADHNTNLDVQIFRFNGNLLFRQKYAVVKGVNYITVNGLDKLAPGMYVLRFSTDTSTSSLVISKL